MLLYANQVKENNVLFNEKVKDISELLKIDPNWLMTIMHQESEMNHRKYNAFSGLYGLLQLPVNDMKRWGISTKTLFKMSNVEQLDCIYHYLKPFSNQIQSFSDLYLVLFYPTALDKPKDYLLGTELGRPAKKNMLRLKMRNRNLFISKTEFENWIYIALPEHIQHYLRSTEVRLHTVNALMDLLSDPA